MLQRRSTAPLKRSAMKRKGKNLIEEEGEDRHRYAKALLPQSWPLGYIPEKTFQANIESLAASLGWMASHSHLPFFDTAGWPDLALLHPTRHRFMVRELKVTSERGVVGRPTPMQWRWLSGLVSAGIDAGVWTWPFDWDRAVQELSA